MPEPIVQIPIVSRRPSTCFMALALLALGWAQVFGLTRGYWCDCSGIGHVSAFDHCHGDHGHDCHHDESPLHSHEDHDDDKGETHEHAPVKEALNAQPHVSLFAPACAATCLEILPLFQLNLASAWQLAPALRPPPRHDVLRPWPDVLAHTIALRI